MLQNFLLKQMLVRQGVPNEQIDMVLELVAKNPDLFKKIAEEAQEKVTSGMGQTEALQRVMQKYESELKALKQ